MLCFFTRISGWVTVCCCCLAACGAGHWHLARRFQWDSEVGMYTSIWGQLKGGIQKLVWTVSLWGPCTDALVETRQNQTFRESGPWCHHVARWQMLAWAKACCWARGVITLPRSGPAARWQMLTWAKACCWQLFGHVFICKGGLNLVDGVMGLRLMGRAGGRVVMGWLGDDVESGDGVVDGVMGWWVWYFV